MTFRAAGFDWDDGNRDKCQKHGITISEIEEVFLHSPLVAPDPNHSQSEERLIAIGRTSAGRYAFVAFAMRIRGGRHLVRPVSARFMHAKEIASYEKSREEESAQTQDRRSG